MNGALFTLSQERVAIGDGFPPLIVAEIGANHDGSPDKAAAMIESIARLGVRAVKFQFYTAAELVADTDRVVTWGPPERQITESVGDMFNRLSLSYDALKELFAHARRLELIPFATPFSEGGVDRLMDLDPPCFKIAASDVKHLPMLNHIARTNKPVILSLGKCTLAEADRAVDELLTHGCPSLAILHCVATYPSPISEMNLRVISALKAIYPDHVIGFSDHSIGIHAATAAVALGARIIEKHVTMNRFDTGPDHWFSLDMNELKALNDACHDVYHALGHPRKRVLACEEKGRMMATRSIILARHIRAGTPLSMDDIKITRPGTGLEPALLPALMGLRVQRDYPPNTPVTWDMFK